MKDLWLEKERENPYKPPYGLTESVLDITHLPSIGDLIDKLNELEEQGELNEDDW